MSSTRVERRVLLGDEPLVYTWVRSRRRRHVHLVVDERNGLEVRTPAWSVADEADQLVVHNAAWIRQTLAQQAARRTPLTNGTRLPLLDLQLELQIRPRHRVAVERRGQQLVAAVPSCEEVVVRAALEAWYRTQARVRLGERLDELAVQTGLQPTGLTIRAQRTRWGSCTSQGRISLNWRLLLMPQALVDYVLVHELCHLRHMNHSPAYWALLESKLPGYQAAKRRVDAIRGGELPL